MTWLKFIYWITGLYALYYLANIAWDLMRQKRKAEPEVLEMNFGPAPAPQKVEPPPKKDADKANVEKKSGEPAISAIGGVALKDLFNLAKAEVIAYNRAVSF